MVKKSSAKKLWLMMKKATNNIFKKQEKNFSAKKIKRIFYHELGSLYKLFNCNSCHY